MRAVLKEASTNEPVSGAYALARGAIEAGVSLVTGYPGAPTTAVVNSILTLTSPDEVQVEWTSNEKVAIEMAFGVRSAMPTTQALRLCPQAIVLSPHHEVYRGYSARMMAILSEYSSLIEPLSLDEAFPSTALRRSSGQGSGHRLDATGCQARCPSSSPLLSTSCARNASRWRPTTWSPGVSPRSSISHPSRSARPRAGSVTGSTRISMSSPSSW
jgi:hypothetical protein